MATAVRGTCPPVLLMHPKNEGWGGPRPAHTFPPNARLTPHSACTVAPLHRCEEERGGGYRSRACGSEQLVASHSAPASSSSRALPAPQPHIAYRLSITLDARGGEVAWGSQIFYIEWWQSFLAPLQTCPGHLTGTHGLSTPHNATHNVRRTTLEQTRLNLLSHKQLPGVQESREVCVEMRGQAVPATIPMLSLTAHGTYPNTTCMGAGRSPPISNLDCSQSLAPRTRTPLTIPATGRLHSSHLGARVGASAPHR